MKKVLAGALLTAIFGGFFFHLQSRYHTLSACQAAESALTSAVIDSLRRDVERSLAPDLPRQLTDLMFQPLTEPLVKKRVELYLADSSWFGCAGKLLQIDLLGADPLIREVRSLTVRL